MNLPPTKPTTAAPFTDCDHCRSHNRLYLHNVRLRGLQRRLCTSCVLSLHPASFCPSCFQFYDVLSSSSSSALNLPPPPSERITCVKCSSISHSDCVSSTHRFPSSSYLCPPCADPRFFFFDVDSKNGKRAIDEKSARVLLCAAKIASVSMSNAVNVAKLDAEKRVREATVAKRRAKEALGHVGFLEYEVKLKAFERSGDVLRSENVVQGKKKDLNCGRIVVKMENCSDGFKAPMPRNPASMAQKSRIN